MGASRGHGHAQGRGDQQYQFDTVHFLSAILISQKPKGNLANECTGEGGNVDKGSSMRADVVLPIDVRDHGKSDVAGKELE